MIGDIIGGIGQAIGQIWSIPAARKTRNKTVDAQNKATETQKDIALQSLSLEERMVKLSEDQAMQAAAAAQNSPSSGIGDYMPWIVGGGIIAYLLLKK